MSKLSDNRFRSRYTKKYMLQIIFVVDWKEPDVKDNNESLLRLHTRFKLFVRLNCWAYLDGILCGDGLRSWKPDSGTAE